MCVPRARNLLDLHFRVLWLYEWIVFCDQFWCWFYCHKLAPIFYILWLVFLVLWTISENGFISCNRFCFAFVHCFFGWLCECVPFRLKFIEMLGSCKAIFYGSMSNWTGKIFEYSFRNFYLPYSFSVFVVLLFIRTCRILVFHHMYGHCSFIGTRVIAYHA